MENKTEEERKMFFQMEIDKLEKEQKERDVILDAKHKKEGFTHKVDCWIHSKGDDVNKLCYLLLPTTMTEKDINSYVVKNVMKKSAIKSDFKVTKLL